MVDWGFRTSVCMWTVSLAAQMAYWLGWVNLTFMVCWSTTSIIDKTLKMISRQREAAFMAWSDRVWNSCMGRSVGHGDHDGTDTELPTRIYRP